MKFTCRILFVLILFGRSSASDFNPPTWRGLPGSTYQKWSFSTSDTSPIADDYNNPYGTPTVAETIDGDWIDEDEYQQGIWNAQTINFSSPYDNTISDDMIYRVSMTWDVQATTLPDLRLYIGDTLDNTSVVEADIVEDYYVPNSLWWRYTVFEVTTQIFPSTPVIYYEAEFVHLSKITPIYVDEVIIDTIVVPEPATLILLAGGGLMIRRSG